MKHLALIVALAEACAGLPAMDAERASKRHKPVSRLEGVLKPEEIANLEQIKVLVVGAGGLGCEILKNLVGSGFMHIHVIDMDSIDLTNLNRQFLFHEEDIGLAKAEVAARKVGQFWASYGSSAEVVPHVNRIEDMPDAFYSQFHIVVCGLDSVEARRWINAKLVSLCYEDPSASSLRPLIDGGSEGFRGQCRVILPGITPCYECTLDLIVTGDAESYPLCTIASIPRLPEHCVEWVKVVKWPQLFGTSKLLDADNEEDMALIYNAARERASEFEIEGVTLELVYGVIKRIVPAVASTNAIIAASCSLEAFKLASGVGTPLNNYFMYAGDEGVHTSVFEFEKREDCLVCGSSAIELHISPEDSLENVLKVLQIKMGGSSKALPSMLSQDGRPLFMNAPKSLRDTLKCNLPRPMKLLLSLDSDVSRVEVSVTHSSLPRAIRVSLYLDHR